MSSAERPLRVPITVASKRGVSWLNKQAASRRVLLTKYNRVNAVVDSPEHLDETAKLIENTRREVVGAFADRGLERADHRFSLSKVCAELGLDEARVRERADELAAGH